MTLCILLLNTANKWHRGEGSVLSLSGATIHVIIPIHLSSGKCACCLLFTCDQGLNLITSVEVVAGHMARLCQQDRWQKLPVSESNDLEWSEPLAY